MSYDWLTRDAKHYAEQDGNDCGTSDCYACAHFDGAAVGMGLLLMALAIQEQQRDKARRMRTEWGLRDEMGVWRCERHGSPDCYGCTGGRP